MSDGSRFGSLGRRVLAGLRSGETSVLALAADDASIGTRSGDFVLDATGDDTAQGGGGDDTLAGDDTAAGGGGDDTVTGGTADSSGPTNSDGQLANEASVRADERGKERTRVAEVFASDAVKGREAAAVTLLTETDMPADKIVAKLPQFSAAASSDGMLASLKGNPNPQLGAGAEAQGTTKTGSAVWDKIRGR